MPTPLVDPALEPLGVRDEEVVADELHAVAELGGQLLPGVPVVLGGAVLDRDDREARDQVGPEARDLAGAELAALEAVGAVAEDLARRRVERDRDRVAVPGALGGLEDRLDRRLARRKVGGEAALVADGGREPALVEHAR